MVQRTRDEVLTFYVETVADVLDDVAREARAAGSPVLALAAGDAVDHLYVLLDTLVREARSSIPLRRVETD